MANLDRGAYDSDKLHDFDTVEMSDDSEKSRLPLLVLIALVVLAAFGGVVWLAYTQGVEKGRADSPKMIVAQTHPASAKIAPSPYAGLNIYQSAVPAAPESENKDTLPPPPAKLAAAHLASTSLAANTPPALRPSAAVRQEPPLPAPTVLNSRASRAASEHPAAQTTTAPDSDGVKSEPVQAPPPVPSPTATIHTTIPNTSAPNGRVLLQIGSYKSDSEAMRSWDAFKGRHAAAGAYRPDIQKVALGSKGVWYRLRLGAFADKKSAIEVCEKLKAQGASCLVAK